MDQNSSHYLRTEARPLSWPSLNKSQREVFSKIVNALSESVSLADSYDQTKSKSSPRFLDADRRNRILMLSGERGMGKTSLMLSIEQAFLEPQSWRAGFTEAGNDIQQEWSTKVESGYENVRNRLVWLNTLDLEPLPSPANLLVGVLARVDQAIRDLSAADRGGLDFRDQNSSDLLIELRRLTTDASLAWHGNVEARAASLDPDVYASEVLRAEVARLSLNDRFGQVLQRASHEFHWKNASKPIFILPVDDVDLNPIRCLELLRLIRMVSTPRLTTLILGDAHEMQRILALRHAGEWGEIAKDPNAKVFKNADSVSHQSMRKLVPPEQRYALSPLTIEEIREFSAIRNRSTLFDLLAKLNIDIHRPFQPGFGNLKEKLTDFSNNLQSFLFPESQVCDSANEDGDARNKIYRALKIFRVPQRAINDLWMKLSQFGSNNAKPKETLRLLIELAEYSLAFDQIATDSIGQIFEKARNDGFFRTSMLRVNNERSFVESIETTNVPNFCTINLDEIVEQRLAFRSELGSGYANEANHDRFGAFVSPTTDAFLTLIHDLTVVQNNPKILGDWLTYDLAGASLTTATWKAYGEDFKFDWPPPFVNSFREIDIFMEGWRKCISARSSGYDASDENRVVDLALDWICLSCALLLGEKYSLLPTASTTSSTQLGEKFSIAIAGMERLVDSEKQKSNWQVKSTLNSLPSLLTFEAGLPTAFCNRVLKSDRLKGYWNTHFAEIVNQHQARLRHYGQGDSKLRTAITNPIEFLKTHCSFVEQRHKEKLEQFFQNRRSSKLNELHKDLIDLDNDSDRERANSYMAYFPIFFKSVDHPLQLLTSSSNIFRAAK